MSVRRMHFFFVFLIPTLLNFVEGALCPSSGNVCLDWESYQVCVNLNNNAVLVGQAQSCPSGTICDQYDYFPCKKGTPPTTISPVTAPPCYGPLNSSAPYCNQYYECNPVYVIWVIAWWQPDLKTCPNGQNFDSLVSTCVDGVGDCPVDITTTTPAPVTQPQCSAPGKYPAPSENQYYECVSFFFWWFPQLYTCPSGQIFSATLQDCTGVTTTTENTEGTTVATTTAESPVTEPQCNGPGKYPAPQPNQYYECVNSWIFWWYVELSTCPSGQLFNSSLQDCCDDNSESIVTTSSSGVTTSGQIITDRVTATTSNSGITTSEQPTTATTQLTTKVTTVATTPEPDDINGCSANSTSSVPISSSETTPEITTNPTTSEQPSTTTTQLSTKITTVTTTLVPDDISGDSTNSTTSVPISSSETTPETTTNPTTSEQPSTTTTQLTTKVTTVTTTLVSEDINADSTNSITSVRISSSETTTETTTNPPVIEPQCNGPGKYPAPQPNQYYECVNSWIFWWYAQLNTCPSGQIFNSTLQDCCDNAPTIFTTSDSGITSSAQRITDSTTIATNITTEVTTVATTLSQDTTTGNIDCNTSGITSERIGSTEITTDGTTNPPVTEPQCNGPGKYPAPQPNQYYECVNSWIFWWYVQLSTCPSGQVFVAALQDCYIVTTTPAVTSSAATTTETPSGCPGVTSTVTTTTEVQTEGTTNPPVTEPQCSGAGKYPGPQPNQYYECVNSWIFWWYVQLNTCPSGQVFSMALQNCYAQSI